jgi:hypothetical protein
LNPTPAHRCDRILAASRRGSIAGRLRASCSPLKGGDVYSLRFSFLILSVSVPSLADAQRAPKEVALASTLKDAQLKWGPCPPFIPKGCRNRGASWRSGQSECRRLFQGALELQHSISLAHVSRTHGPGLGRTSGYVRWPRTGTLKTGNVCVWTSESSTQGFLCKGGFLGAVDRFRVSG